MRQLFALGLAAAALLDPANADIAPILPEQIVRISLQDPWMTPEWQQHGFGPSDVVCLGGVIMMAINFARKTGRYPTNNDRATLTHLVAEVSTQFALRESGVERIILDAVAQQSTAQTHEDDLIAAMLFAASDSHVLCAALKKHGLPDDFALALVRKLVALRRQAKDIAIFDIHGLALESQRLLKKYPERVPIVCSKATKSRSPTLAKEKYLVPGTMLLGEFKYVLHKNMTDAGWSENETLYILAQGLSLKTGSPMSEVYEACKAADGFLHITYGAENTLGYAPNH